MPEIKPNIIQLRDLKTGARTPLMAIKGEKGDKGDTYDDTEIRSEVTEVKADLTELEDDIKTRTVNLFDINTVLKDKAISINQSNVAVVVNSSSWNMNGLQRTPTEVMNAFVTSLNI